MIAKLKARFKRLPKPIRFLLKLLGKALTLVTAPVWLPAVVVLWLLLMALCPFVGWLIQVYEDA